VTLKPSAKKVKVELCISSKKTDLNFQCSAETGKMILDLVQRCSVYNPVLESYSVLEKDFEILFSKAEMMLLKQYGLLIL
jgi:hypothetical protein